MGLNVFLYKMAGDVPNEDDDTAIELPSAKHPDHYFKIGYFRSAYGGSGFNSTMHRMGLPNLDDIFSPGCEEYVFPDWKKAIKKARGLLMAMDREKISLYREAVEIVIETCKYVLDNPGRFYLRWGR